MTYINKETAKKIREALRAEFKEIKFSVRMRDRMALDVSIMQSPYFEADEYTQVNHYYIDEHYSGIQKEVLSKIKKIILEVGDHYDNSDSMADYFDVAFYYNISIGRYGKGHIVRAN